MDLRKSHVQFFTGLDESCDLVDEDSRRKKAEKIFSVCEDYARENQLSLSSLKCLDIGCSTGLISKHLCSKFEAFVGVDPDARAMRMAKSGVETNAPIHFVLSDGAQTPFPPRSFDVIICNQVYEHVPDAEKLFQEIFRLLKFGGFCYLSAGNKFMIIEPHYKLPLLSWLPQFLANVYLRVTRGVDVYAEKHYSYWELKKALGSFQIVDYTLKVIKEPKKFHLENMVRENSLAAKLPVFFLKMIEPLIPNYIFILAKPGSERKA